MLQPPMGVFLHLTLVMTLTLSFGIAAQADKVSITAEKRLRTLEERLLRLENRPEAKRQKRSDDNEAWEAVTAGQAQEIASLTAQLQAAQNRITTLESTQGSTFVRWGHSQCPSNSDIVYSGIAGGAKRDETGSGANQLCLTHSPQFDQATPLGGYHSNIHGTEWYVPGHGDPGAPDIPCAVCRAPHPSTIMIPGTKACPQSWTIQYAGHIVSDDVRYTSNSEFLCADENGEDREGGGTEVGDGSYFMYSVASCGTLPCPPYVNGKVVTCVVCSK